MDSTTKTSTPKKPDMKMIGIIIGAVILVVLLVVVFGSSKKQNVNTNSAAGDSAANTSEATPGEAANTNPGANTEQPVVTNPAVPKDARVEVAGGNAITKENVVVTHTGTVAKNDVVPMSPEAPQQTAPISKAQLPNTALKMDLSAAGFSPSSVSAKAGAPVTLSITSADSLTHVFMFNDASLAAVAIGVGPGETRAITFNAPEKAGEYTFRCDVPGHSGRGEVGKLIVK